MGKLKIVVFLPCASLVMGRLFDSFVRILHFFMIYQFSEHILYFDDSYMLSQQYRGKLISILIDPTASAQDAKNQNFTRPN